MHVGIGKEGKSFKIRKGDQEIVSNVRGFKSKLDLHSNEDGGKNNQ